MPALAQSIKFRWLAAQLNDAEFQQFVSKWLQSGGRDFILTSLYNQFIRTNEDNETEHPVIKPMNIISSIIESREEQANESEIRPTTLDELSSVLIGEIASYLNQKDYISFGKTNRSIYYGSNSPNRLVTLNLLNVVDYASIDLRKYRLIKHLAININKIKELPSTEIVLNNLCALKMDNGDQTNINMISFQEILSCIHPENITYLTLRKFGRLDAAFDTLQFKQLGQSFLRAEYCEFDRVYVALDGIDNDELQTFFPNIRGCGWSGSFPEAEDKMIEVFGNRLVAMGLEGYVDDRRIDIKPSTQFSKLSKMDFSFPRIETVKIINDRSNTLRNVAFFDVPGGTEWKNAIEALIIKQKMLSSIFMELKVDVFEDCLRGIESGIFKASERISDSLRIDFEIVYKLDNMRDSLPRIMSIVNMLHSSTKHFYFYIWTSSASGNEKIEWDLANMNRYSPNVRIEHHDIEIAIMNLNCDLSHYDTLYEMGIDYDQ